MSGESMKKFISVFEDDSLDEKLIDNILLEYDNMNQRTSNPLKRDLNEAISRLEDYYVSPSPYMTEEEEARIEGIYEGISLALNILKDINNRY